MFNFFKDLSNLRADIDDLKFEVYPYPADTGKGSTHIIVTRVADLEDKLDLLLKHLKLTTDYTESVPEVESKLIIRKRTKKDDEPKLPSGWGVWGF